VAWSSKIGSVPDVKPLLGHLGRSSRPFFLCAWELGVPHYHFNWELGSQRVRDEVGVQLTDDDTARQHAAAHRELLLAAFSVERHYEDYGIEVCDPNGETLFRISLR